MQSLKRKVGQDIVKKQPSQVKKVVVGAYSKKDISNKMIKKDTGQTIKNTLVKKERMSEDSFPPLQERLAKRESMFREKTPAKGGVMWVVVIMLIIACGISAASFFSKTVLNLTLEQRDFPIDVNTSLFSEPTENQLSYKTVEVIDKQSYFYPTTKTVDRQEYATGTVKIFNTTSGTVSIPQGELLLSTSGTRFITKEKMVIPKGTVQLPGSKQISIKAQSPGQESNIGMDDFTIKNFPQLTVRSLTEIKGGVIGKQAVISSVELESVQSIVLEKFKKEQSSLYFSNQIPDGFLLPKELISVGTITFEQNPTEQGVEVIAQRKITGYLLDENNLYNYLKKNILPEQDQSIFSINKELSGLKYKLTDQQDGRGIIISGNLVVQATKDTDDIKNIIRGQKIKKLSEIMNTIPNVVGYSAETTPFWVRKVPLKNRQIIININYLVK